MHVSEPGIYYAKTSCDEYNRAVDTTSEHMRPSAYNNRYNEIVIFPSKSFIFELILD